MKNTNLILFCLGFVSNEREGLILETPCKLEDSVDGTSKLDIEIEGKIIEETLKEFTNRSEETITTLAMKHLGQKR